MGLYRRVALWPLRKRIALHISIVLACSGVMAAAHNEIDDHYDRAKAVIAACDAWLSIDDNRRDKATMYHRGERVRAYCQVVESTTIHYFDGKDFLPDVGPGIHQTYEGQYAYAEIIGDHTRERVFVAYPKGDQRFRWMNQFPQRASVAYLEFTDQTRTASRRMVFESPQEICAVALGYMSIEHTGFRARLQGRRSEAQEWVTIHDVTHTWLVKMLVIGLLLLIMLPLLDAFPEFTVIKAVEAYALEPPAEQALTQAIREAWLDGITREGIRRRCAATAKRLAREQARLADKSRREKLRLITDEANAKRLADLADAKAKQARQRLRDGDTTIGAELANLRSAMGKQTSDVARLAESGFFHVIAEPDVPPDDEETTSDRAREQAEKAVRACSHALQPLDRFSQDELIRLAALLRVAKRKLPREAWRKLCQRFDPAHPAQFIKVVSAAAEAGEQALRSSSADGSSTSERLKRQEPAEIPRLLAGKNVILLGGDPGLEPFYREQIARLGGHMLLHHVGGNPVRLRDHQPDLFLMLYQRTDHKCQNMARSMGVKIIWLTKLSKSAFLAGAIEDIRAQT